MQQHQRVLEDGFLRVEIGDEVGRQETLVEAHALGDLQLGTQRGGFLDRHDTVGADLGHRLAHQLADLLVARGHRGDLADGLAVVDRRGRCQQRLRHGVGGLVDARPQRDRVGARGDVAQPGLDHGLREHGRGGGAVTGNVVGLGGDRLDQLRAEILERILEIDVAGDGHPVVGDGRSTESLGQHHMPTTRPERHLDRVGQLVDAGLHRAARGFVEFNLFAHRCLSLVEG